MRSPKDFLKNKATLATLSATLIALATALAQPSDPPKALQENRPFRVESNEPHSAQLIQHGAAALELRLQMIERARKSIEVEYFIYNTDRAGRLISQALIRKKRENPAVQIRILLDASGTVLQLDEYYAAELAKHGIEVKYYNDTPLLRLVTTQYRNHRKAIIIDGEEAITGGRNIGDEYFDLNATFNFIDRDLWLQGPLVAEMKATFDRYWENKRVSARELPRRPEAQQYGESNESHAQYQADLVRYESKAEKAAALMQETPEDRALRQQIAEVAAANLQDPASRGQCGHIRFVTDEPGFDWLRNKRSPKRQVRDTLMARIAQVTPEDRLLVESPYFILKEYGKKVITDLSDRGVKATVLTNSLASTDAFYVAAIFNTRSPRFAKRENLKFYTHNGKPLPGTRLVKGPDGRALAEKAVWGTHAKTLAFNERDFAVGTFNLDPRSANLNTEMIVFCEDAPELAQAVRADIQARLTQAFELGPDGQPILEKTTQLTGASVSKVVPYLLSIVPASMLDFLF